MRLNMEEELFLPSEYKGDVLDFFLSKGWFRALSYGVMFTTSHLEKEEVQVPVHWLRYDVSKFHYGSSQRRLLKKNQKEGFKVTFETFRIDEELETLFSKYKELATFTYITSLEETFASVMDTGVYDTGVLKIRDGEKLIAAGLFDIGNESIAPILNYYDPDYQSFGLGKLLLMMEIGFSLQNKIQYVYPGYIAPGIDKFNFKLFPDKKVTEVFIDQDKKWIDYHVWNLIQLAEK